MDWRKIFSKSEHIKDSFKNYKVPDSKAELPNRAEFSGDKFPSSGDSAKVELNAWHAGNNTFKKDKSVEDKSKIPSPIIEEKNRREFVGDKTMERKSGWRATLMSFGEVTFRQKKDGDIEIDVSDNASKEEASDINTNENFNSETPEKTASNWRKVLSMNGEPDINFKRKNDGTFELNVTHPQPETEETDNFNQNEQLSTTPPQPGAIPPSSPQGSNPTTSSKNCASSHKDMKEWVIRKDGNLSLVGRDCSDKAGIFIINNPSSRFSKKASQTIIAQEVIEKKGKTWRELINEAVWLSKYEQLLNKGS